MQFKAQVRKFAIRTPPRISTDFSWLVSCGVGVVVGAGDSRRERRGHEVGEEGFQSETAFRFLHQIIMIMNIAF